VRSRGCATRLCVNWEHMQPVPGHVNTSRGDSLSARVARSGFCKRGHSMADAVVDNRKSRPPSLRCRTCRDERRTALRDERRKSALDRIELELECELELLEKYEYEAAEIVAKLRDELAELDKLIMAKDAS